MTHIDSLYGLLEVITKARLDLLEGITQESKRTQNQFFTMPEKEPKTLTVDYTNAQFKSTTFKVHGLTVDELGRLAKQISFDGWTIGPCINGLLICQKLVTSTSTSNEVARK